MKMINQMVLVKQQIRLEENSMAPGLTVEYMVFVGFHYICNLITQGVDTSFSGAIIVYEYRRNKTFGRCTIYHNE